MLTLPFFNRKKAPLPEVAPTAAFAERLSDMVQADRQAVGDARSLRDIEPRRRPNRPIISAKAVPVKPARQARSAAPSASKEPAKSMATKAATVKVNPSSAPPAAPVAQPPTKRTAAAKAKREAAAKAPVAPSPKARAIVAKAAVKPSVKAEKPKAKAPSKPSSGTNSQFECFREFAKGQKLSVARKGEDFINPLTQQAWVTWQEASRHARAETEKPLFDEIAALKKLVDAVSHAPIQSSSPNALDDLTVVVKRLAVSLHQADGSNPLAQRAMDYLHAHGLIGLRIDLSRTA